MNKDANQLANYQLLTDVQITKVVADGPTTITRKPGKYFTRLEPLISVMRLFAIINKSSETQDHLAVSRTIGASKPLCLSVIIYSQQETKKIYKPFL